MVDFLTYEEAKVHVRAVSLKKQDDYRAYIKTLPSPRILPSKPEDVYKEHWTTLADFLGTRKVNFRRVSYLPFKKARQFVRALGLKGYKEWVVYSKTDRPLNIPANPYKIYWREWEGWGDFLGTGRVKNKSFYSFQTARRYVRSLNIRTHAMWQAYLRENQPKDPILRDKIPCHPDKVYKGEWVSWPDWFGTPSRHEIRKKRKK